MPPSFNENGLALNVRHETHVYMLCACYSFVPFLSKLMVELIVALTSHFVSVLYLLLEAVWWWPAFQNSLSRTLHFWGDQIKKEMGGACGTYGGDEVHVGFCWGNLKDIEHLEDLDVDGSSFIL